MDYARRRPPAREGRCPQLLESQFQGLPQDGYLDVLQLSRPMVRRPAPKLLQNLFLRQVNQLHGVLEQAQSAPWLL